MRLIATRSEHDFVQGLITDVNDGPFGVVRRYSGGFLPEDFGDFGANNHLLDFAGAWAIEPEASLGDPSPYGPIGWQKFRPRMRAVDLPLVLYELKDLPEQLKTTAEGFRDLFHAAEYVRGGGGLTRRAIRQALPGMPKEAANHFLNHVFGWAPFVSDVATVHRSVAQYNDKLARLIAENNQWVHRGGTISESDEVIAEYDSRDSSFPRIYPLPDVRLLRSVDMGDGRNHFGLSSYTLRKKERIWFVGEFRYNIPSLSRDNEAFQHVLNLLHYYGVRISPDLIWKATPWSWLGDWFANTGEIFSYIADKAEQDLAARYAYVMREVTYTKTHTAVIHLRDGTDRWMSWSQEIHSKRRARASPFGLTPTEELSSRQLAILAALGISRAL